MDYTKGPLIEQFFKGTPKENPNIPAAWLVGKTPDEIKLLLAILHQRYVDWKSHMTVSKEGGKMIKNIVRGATRWWHHDTPKPFYMVKVLGNFDHPTTRCHASRGVARREAVRLAKVTGLPTFVTKTVEVVLPQQKAPAPEMEIHCYDGERTDYFNWTAEGYPEKGFAALERKVSLGEVLDALDS